MTDFFGQNLIGQLPRLRRFALSLARSNDVADDLVQITCQKALTNRSGFQEGTRLDAWLFRILRNSWIDMTRRSSARGHQVDIDDVQDLSGSDGEKTTEDRLMLKRTFDAILRLPDEQRETIMIVCVEEMTYKEASAILEVPVGTVMSRLARARKKLGEDLGINDAPNRFPTKNGKAT